jgi:hypothetical protein
VEHKTANSTEGTARTHDTTSQFRNDSLKPGPSSVCVRSLPGRGLAVVLGLSGPSWQSRLRGWTAWSPKRSKTQTRPHRQIQDALGFLALRPSSDLGMRVHYWFKLHARVSYSDNVMHDSLAACACACPTLPSLPHPSLPPRPLIVSGAIFARRASRAVPVRPLYVKCTWLPPIECSFQHSRLTARLHQ